MNDQEVLDHIDELVKEEKELRKRHEETETGLGSEDQSRLEKLEVDLDRYWDLLRQRRSLRETGGDPDDATIRDEQTVEDYEQ
jgi:predicted nuclease with TOPRIM domain